MVDRALLARHWVEIREECRDDRIVLRPFDSPIPPARGRRSLLLAPGHGAETRAPGPADRSLSAGGGWALDGGILVVDAPGWEGRYRIEELSEDRLVLVKE